MYRLVVNKGTGRALQVFGIDLPKKIFGIDMVFNMKCLRLEGIHVA